MHLKSFNANPNENLENEISIDDMIEQVVSTYRETCNNKGIDLIVADLLKINGTFHAKNIQTVLMNIIGNAVKFTEQGSIVITPKITADMITISIKDSGQGIDPEIKDKIFKTYGVQSKIIKKHSSGLGLRICALILDAISGTINFTSEIGKGTEFVFSFPFIKNNFKIVEEPIKEVLIEPMLINHKKILIVEDNILLQRVYDVILKELHSCDFASNSSEAIIKMSIINKYDVILMDYHLPNVSGIECAKIIRISFGDYGMNIPIIFITGEIGIEVNNEIKNISNSYLITKPVKRLNLLDFINNI
jgi:CheY-like chemotaxis protein